MTYLYDSPQFDRTWPEYSLTCIEATLMYFVHHAVRRRALAVLIAGAAFVLSVSVAVSPAHASLTPGTGWTAVSLPAGYATFAMPSPVSCVAGTGFCVLVTFNTTGQGDLVTSDGGMT